MRSEWGRSDVAGRWLSTKPVWVATALVLGLTSALVVTTYDVAVRWTPLQRAYAPAYARCTMLQAIGVTAAGRYRLLQVVTPKGHRLALDEEVRRAPDATTGASLTLTEIARQMGDRALVEDVVTYRPDALCTLFRHWVYPNHTIGELARRSVWIALAVTLAGLVIGVPADVLRARSRRHGRRLKGPELVTTPRFNRPRGWWPAIIRALLSRPQNTNGRSSETENGIGFTQRPTVFGRERIVRVPRSIESSHFLIMGDSGTGKSVLIRQLLTQIEARGGSAIVYDPALEYVGQFYNAERQDVILNPLDARSPFWNPADEWLHEAEALTIATSLFPDRHQENPFFTEAPRRIFAHLLTLKPSPAELSWWLSHVEQIDVRLSGTPYASMIDKQAPAQRAGVLASLNMVADTLKLLPARADARRTWSATGWSVAREGWIFLTSTPETRPRLVPLTSLWLDTLVLRLMNQGRPSARPTWFVLDELASLQRLPQLHTAITENRKSNNPVVLGFQGRSQLETRYGHDAEAMLSQPATKIFLRTTEPRAAQWVSDCIGSIEIERLRESRSIGRGQQQSYVLERQVEPLVMPSEISGLPALHGFLKLGNLVVRLAVPFVSRPTTVAAFVERPRPARVPQLPVANDTRAVLAERPPEQALVNTQGSRVSNGAGQEQGR